MLELAGRVVLVTGASSGIGRSTAVVLSRLGARVVLVARRAAELEQTQRLLDGQGHRVEPLDLAAADLPAWLKSLAAETGPLDGLVHAAGVHTTRPVRMLTADAFEAPYRINVTAGALLARGLRQSGVHAEGASLVLVSSVVGLAGQPGVSAYSATKGAVLALTRSLALELAADRIRVNCVVPGQVRSEMFEQQKKYLLPEQVAAIEAAHPLGLGEPEDVARAIAFLLSPASRWITGTGLVVDGGYLAR